MEAAQAQAQATQDINSTPPRRSKNYGKPMVTVRMPPELKERLDDYSIANHISVNKFCIEAIAAHLNWSEEQNIPVGKKSPQADAEESQLAAAGNLLAKLEEKAAAATTEIMRDGAA